jgi:hypothetical protein
MTGRPTLYTAEIAERILDALTSGRSLSSACKDEGMPHLSTALDWVREDRDGFAARYETARKIANPACAAVPPLYSDAIAERLLGELRRAAMAAVENAAKDIRRPAEPRAQARRQLRLRRIDEADRRPHPWTAQ